MEEFRKLSKNALKCRYVVAMIGTIIELGILAVITYFTREIDLMWINIVLAIIGIIIIMVGILRPYFRHKNYKYRINDEFIEVIEGHLYRERTVVPIERLHKIEVSEGPIAKIFGVADITIVSGGGEVELEYIDAQYANEIATSLGKRINEIVIKQRKKI